MENKRGMTVFRPALAILCTICFAVNGYSESVSLFQCRQDYFAGKRPTSIAGADFNNDGRCDLAVGCEEDSAFSVLFSQNYGIFGPPAKYDVPSIPRDLISADFNGDGFSDLAVVSGEMKNYPYPENTFLTIFLNNGTGYFAVSENYPITELPYSLTCDDYNLDGHSDLAIASGFDGRSYVGYRRSECLLTIALGTGDGTFQLSEDYIFPESYPEFPSKEAFHPEDIISADFNNDNLPDLAIGIEMSNYSRYWPDEILLYGYRHAYVTVLLGTGNGSFLTPALYPVALSPRSLAAADFDLDGNTDIVSAGNLNLNRFYYQYYTLDPPAIVIPHENVSILLNSGGGIFEDAISFVVAGGSSSIVARDFDDDNITDLITANSEGDTLSFHKGAGNGAFEEAITFAAGSHPSGIAVGDFNGNGVTDLAAANRDSDTVSIFFKKRHLFRTAKEYKRDFLPSSIACDDFNQDGNADMAVANWDGNSVSVLRGDGSGNLASAGDFPVGLQPVWIISADFDLNGQPDLATANRTSNDVSVLLNTGGDGFAPAAHLSVGSYPSCVVSADFNGDSAPDLAVSNRGNDNVSVFLGDGSGSFPDTADYPVNKSPLIVTAADFNLDGFSDLAVLNRGDENGSISILTGNSDGTLTALPGPDLSFMDENTCVISLSTGDLNSDSTPDLIAGYRIREFSLDRDKFGIYLFVGAGDGTFPSAVEQPVPDAAEPSYPVVTDIDTGGIPDLVVCHRNLNNVSLNTDSLNFSGYLGAGRFPAQVVSSDFNSDGKSDLATANHGSSSITLLLSRGENHPPVADAGPSRQRYGVCSPAGGIITLNGSASTDPDSSPGTNDDIASFRWYRLRHFDGIDVYRPGQIEYLGSEEFLEYYFDCGRYSVKLITSDFDGETDEAYIWLSVSHDDIPPRISVTLTPNVLWPPNHNLVEINAVVEAKDIFDPNPEIELVSITSSESGTGNGGGNGSGDIQEAEFGTDDRSFLLRAERSGRGESRVYTVTYKATDYCNNSATACATVVVPHDRRKR